MQSRILRSPARSAALGLFTALCLAAPACTSSVDPDSVSESGDELKGGIPANGKEKSNKGKHNGQASSVSMDDDAGVPGVGKGKGRGKDKVKKPKVKGPKAGDTDQDASIDEDTDEEADEAVDEDADEGADEDTDEEADEAPTA